MVLWRSRWSGVMLVMAETLGWNSIMVSSWKLETSATVTDSSVVSLAWAV